MSTERKILPVNFFKMPGCYLNRHAFRSYSVHPDIEVTILVKPMKKNALVTPAGEVDMAAALDHFPAEGKAVTSPVFIRRVKL